MKIYSREKVETMEFNKIVSYFRRLHKAHADVLLYAREFKDKDGALMFGLDKDLLAIVHAEYEFVNNLLYKKKGAR